MSRWIDGHDVIEHAETNCEDREFIRILMDYIEDAPSIDLVRCRDCKHHYTTADDENFPIYHYCNLQRIPVSPDNFCSYGCRKESE